MNRARIRDLGIKIGRLPTGKFNAITDVPGVLVGQKTVIRDEPYAVRTGITAIVPRDGAIGKDYAFGGFYRLNGCGEMTGIQWLEETGMLTSVIALTNTAQVGMARDALTEFSFTNEGYGPFFLPVATETYDGWLNDYRGHQVSKEDIFKAILEAKSGPVDEGDVGGGTGMICYEFKGGIGTSSRIVEIGGKAYTVGVLVQANHGDREQLRIDGIPVGREIGYDKTASPWDVPTETSSIVIVIGTNAPLLGDQCKRLAQRATIGLARTGGIGQNGSGDLFLAFATGNHIPYDAKDFVHLEGMLAQNSLNILFEATADAVEESILNALTAAETMTGNQGHTAHAIPLDELQNVLRVYRKLQ